MAALINLHGLSHYLVLIHQFSFCAHNNIYTETSQCPSFHFLCCSWGLRVERRETERKKYNIFFNKENFDEHILYSCFLIHKDNIFISLYNKEHSPRNAFSLCSLCSHPDEPASLLSPSVLVPRSPAVAAESWGILNNSSTIVVEL